VHPYIGSHDFTQLPLTCVRQPAARMQLSQAARPLCGLGQWEQDRYLRAAAEDSGDIVRHITVTATNRKK
jgi:hypothetical protein